MVRLSVSLGVLSAAALLSGCSPQPCTSCLKIGGDYLESTQASTVDCKAWRYLLFGGGTGAVTLTQSGSTLRLNGMYAMKGELFEDNSASFGPTPFTFRPVDNEGNPDPSRAPTPGLLTLHGWFLEGGSGSAVFEGTYVFVTDDELRCEMTSKVVWAR